MSHLNMMVNLSDDDLAIEANIEKEIALISNKITISIKNNIYDDSYTKLNEKSELLTDQLRALKGGALVNRGKRLPSNSTELAKALIEKVDMLGRLEDDALTEKIASIRLEQDKTKVKIEKLVGRVNQLGINNEFEDINHAIEFWEKAKVNIFTKTGEQQANAWAYLVGQKAEFTLCNNYLSHLIRELRNLENKILQLEHHKQVKKQSDYIKSACKRVIASNNDNDAFRDIFLMGQNASELNNIELKLTEYKKRLKSTKKRSEWADELGLRLYIDFWIRGVLPSESNAQQLYPDLLDGREPKTVQNQLSCQRKKLIKVDSRVPKVRNKGRNKAINSHLPPWEF